MKKVIWAIPLGFVITVLCAVLYLIFLQGGRNPIHYLTNGPFLIGLFSIFFFSTLASFFILFSENSKNKKWVFSILGGIYALIPIVFVIINHGTTDNGEYLIYALPPFWPQLVILFIMLIPFGLFAESLHFSSSFDGYAGFIVGTINVLIWALVGYLIGRRKA